MTNTQRENIERIVTLSKEKNPNAIRPLVDSILAQKIHDILEKKKSELQNSL